MNEEMKVLELLLGFSDERKLKQDKKESSIFPIENHKKQANMPQKKLYHCEICSKNLSVLKQLEL